MLVTTRSPDSNTDRGQGPAKSREPVVIETREGHVTKAHGLWLPDDKVLGAKLSDLLVMLFPTYARELKRLLSRASTASDGEEVRGKLLLHHAASGQDWMLDMDARREPSGASVESRIRVEITPLDPKAAEDMLISSSRWLLERCGEGLKLRFWQSDRDHRFTVVTDAPGHNDLTPEPSSMIGRTRWECAGVPDASADPAWQHHLFQLERGQPVADFVYTAKGPYDKATTWSVGAQPSRGQNGEIEGYRGYALDVTELWITRHDLIQSEASMLSVIEQLPVVAAVWSDNSKLLRVSQRTSQITDLPSEVMVGLDREQVQKLLGIKTISDNMSPRTSFSEDGMLLEWQDQNGDKKLWRQTVIGETVRREKICIYIDVTENREEIASAKRRERLEQFGRFASSLAHDLSNLVAVVAGGIRTIRAGKVDEVEEAMDDIETMLGTSRDMIHSLRAVATGVDRQRSVDLDVNAELEQIVRAFNRSNAQTVEMPASGVKAQVHVDPTSFNRAILNLLVNAKEACDENGRIALNLERSKAPGSTIGIVIEDDGPGWPHDLEKMLGDPMVSTKGSTRGFGLAQVVEFAQTFGGAVTFGRSRWGGAKISVNLPGKFETSVADLEDSTAPSSQEATATTPSTETPKHRVLVVDDHKAVRRMVTRTFKSMGWETFQAEGGHEALRLVESMAETLPDLILTDVVMPGMSGKELAAELADRYPSLSLALMSGHIPGGDLAGLPFIQKPFETENIVLLLQTMGLLEADTAHSGNQP